MSMYLAALIISAPIPSIFGFSMVRVVSDFDYVGCYGDEGDLKRRLPYQLAVDSMFNSVESCAALAMAAGYPVFGVQAGSYCFGGMDESYAVSAGRSSNCNTQCTANDQQICGGAWANSVYRFRLSGNGKCPECPIYL